MDKDNHRAVINFEQALQELEQLVKKMERGEVSLSDAVAYYEKGMQLFQICQKHLAEAKLKIELLEVKDKTKKIDEAGMGITGKKDFPIK